MDNNRKTGVKEKIWIKIGVIYRGLNWKRKCLLSRREGQLNIMWLKSQNISIWRKGHIKDEFYDRAKE